MFDRLRRLVAPLHNRAVRSLALAHLVSGLGDWAGRLALTVVVYDRSESAAWAAAVTVVALLPWIGPGQLLATLADRYGRTTVMITSDLARAVLFFLMAFTTSVPVLLIAAFAAGLCVPPFAGARAAALVDVCDDDEYPKSIAMFGVLSQVEVLAGYAAGGVLVAMAGARPALALNAITFLVSAAFVATLLHTPAGSRNASSQVGWAGVRTGLAVWRADPVCGRALTLFAATNMFSVLPETLVVPFADDVGIAETWIGALAATIAVGSLIALVLVPSDGTHEQLLRATAWRGIVAAIAAGVLFTFAAWPIAAFAAYGISGMVDVIAVPTNQVAGQRLPHAGRAAAMTVAAGTQNVTGVVAISAAGPLADRWGTNWTLAVAMGCAALVCVWATVRPIRSTPTPAV
ncbi:MAG: MFS transporter [Ilumatobacter sp.]|nr:MFS transporter [Ilumatobacter sp.]